MVPLPIVQTGSSDDVQDEARVGIGGCKIRLRAEVSVGVMLQYAYVYVRAGTYFLRRGLPTVSCGGVNLMCSDEHNF